MKISEWIAERIASLCAEREISINQLAMDSGLTQSTLNSIMHSESKNPTIITIFRLCRGLTITVSEFFKNIEYGDFEELN